jgi:hypothetical protein
MFYEKVNKEILHRTIYLIEIITVRLVSLFWLGDLS